MLIPSIDISAGRMVQWRQGQETDVVVGDPREAARRWGRLGEVAVVDLDAAVGRGSNLDLVCELCSLAPCRVSGGIRTVETGRLLLRHGARRLVLGSRATPEFLVQFPRELVFAALDVEGEEVVDDGWRRRTGRNVIEAMTELQRFVSGFVRTVVQRTGTMSAAGLQSYERIRRESDLSITDARGIARTAEVVALDRINLDCQVAAALNCAAIDAVDAFVSCIRFSSAENLVPAVVRDAAGRVRMLAWMNSEALEATLRTGKVHFWSRKRGVLWRKGETSGDEMDVETVRADCDRDALLVVTRSWKPACHTGA